MKILYIHQYFKTPQEPGGTRSYWISRELIKNGHQVVMLTASNRFSNKIHRRNIDGIDVIYLNIAYDNGMNILRRLFSFIRFMLRSTFISLFEKDIDIVIATSTPLTVGFPALLLKKIRKIPFLFEVRDLWPEVPFQLGAIKNRIVLKILYWFESTIYQNAEHIVALSPGMVDGIIDRKIRPVKVSMIPNMAKISLFYPRVKDIALAQKLGLRKESFKVIHFGSLGIANGIGEIVKIAKLLGDGNEIEFVFIGSGSTKGDLVNFCKEEDINNVKFLGEFPMDQTSEIVNFCDASLVSFVDIPILYTNSPNKLFDSLSAGKPILVNSSGWTRNLVEENDCGAYFDPKNPYHLIEILIEWLNRPDKVLRMGNNSRKLAESRYDKTILCDQFCKTLGETYFTYLSKSDAIH